jgi:periplasmic copper chaperone A
MKNRIKALLGIAAITFVSVPADAHIGLAGAAGPVFANTSQDLVFTVGHGCNGDDTFAVKIDIPVGVTSVRPMRSDFGATTVEKDGAGNVTAVTWQKSIVDALPSDTGLYKLVVRMRTPNAPFTTLHFPTHQTCRSAAGALTSVDWVAPPGTPTPDGGPVIEPAPAAALLPARVPGWNKFTVPANIADVSVFFKDALIVWKGTAAYSPNAITAAQLKAEPGVTALAALSAGDEVWVKY